jgi:hypothetical protein
MGNPPPTENVPVAQAPVVETSTVTDTVAPTPPVAVVPKPDYKETLSSTSEKIKSSEEFGTCMQQNVNMCIQSAGMQLAQKSKSVEFCKELPTPELQSSCKYGIIMMNATEKWDVTLCSELDGVYKIQCASQIYRSQAMSTKDVSICTKIGTQNEKSGTGIIGPNIGMDEVDQCILSVIMSDIASTEKSCEKLTSDSTKNICNLTMKNKASLPRETPPIPTPAQK